MHCRVQKWNYYLNSAGLAAAEGGESSAAGLITGKQSVIMENPGIPRFFLGPTRLSFFNVTKCEAGELTTLSG